MGHCTCTAAKGRFRRSQTQEPRHEDALPYPHACARASAALLIATVGLHRLRRRGLPLPAVYYPEPPKQPPVDIKPYTPAVA